MSRSGESFRVLPFYRSLIFLSLLLISISSTDFFLDESGEGGRRGDENAGTDTSGDVSDSSTTRPGGSAGVDFAEVPLGSVVDLEEVCSVLSDTSAGAEERRPNLTKSMSTA